MAGSLTALLTDGTLQASPEKFNPSDIWKDTLPLYSEAVGAEPPLAQFAAPTSPAMGPATQLERLQWPAQVWAKLNGDQRARLVHVLKHVIWASDTFCGMGSREQMVYQMLYFVISVTKNPDLAFSQCKVFLVTENDTEKLEFLRKFDPQCSPSHIATDIFHRLPVNVRGKVENMLKSVTRGSTTAGRKFLNQRVCQQIRDVYASGDRHVLRTYYLKHPHRVGCPVSTCFTGEDSDSDIEFGGKDVITVATAAPPCQDASLMNRGDGTGDAGRTMATTEICLQEASQCGHDVVYVECVKRWPLSLLSNALAPKGHRVLKMHLEGASVGDRYNRSRMGGLLLSPQVALTAPIESFLDVFTIGSFFCASRKDEALELAEWRVRRSKPRGPSDPKFWDWEEVLLDTRVTRLAAYMKVRQDLVKAGKLGVDEAVVVDLDQNPAAGFGRMVTARSASFPTLIRHGCHWSITDCRPLLAVKQAMMHCWPITASEITAVGSVVSIGDLLKSGALSCHSLVAMLGDSWHLRVQGMFMMWMLASLTRVSFPLRVMKRSGADRDDDAETNVLEADARKKKSKHLTS